MKQLFLFFLFTLFCMPFYAQDNAGKPVYRFSGFVRSDFIFDSRQSVASCEGLFFLYPKDREEDALGSDLNAQAYSGFYSINTRPAVDLSGLRVFDADATARIESDFAGFGGAYGNATILRIRQAYVNLKWKKSALLLGQNWHPFFLSLYPGQIATSTGAPFQPFARNPQIRFDYQMDKLTLTGAGIYQLQNTSNGPDGKSNVYQKNALLPELTAVANYKASSIVCGVGVNFLTIKPRTRSVMAGKVYKVDENLSSFSSMAYLEYTSGLFAASFKTMYGQNNTDLTMLGGYGIQSIDETTGKQEYTNFNYSTTWLNFSYGKKYKGNLFAGYSRNLGSCDALAVETVYGEGMNISDLCRLAGTFTYNLSHFLLGLEYEFTTANYGNAGTLDRKNGLYTATHGINNHRINGQIKYVF